MPNVREKRGGARKGAGRKPLTTDGPLPNKTVCVPTRLWEAAKQAAARRGESLSAAVRKFLEQYAA